LAYVCGVPLDGCPPAYADFTTYFEGTVHRLLEPTPAARHVADIALNPLDLPDSAGALLALVRLPTVGLLPDRLRAGLALRWSPARATAFSLTGIACRRTVPVLPHRLRYVRSARDAARRLGFDPASLKE
jgi:uncharacterized protein (DUF2236 family)